MQFGKVFLVGSLFEIKCFISQLLSFDYLLHIFVFDFHDILKEETKKNEEHWHCYDFFKSVDES